MLTEKQEQVLNQVKHIWCCAGELHMRVPTLERLYKLGFVDKFAVHADEPGFNPRWDIYWKRL